MNSPFNGKFQVTQQFKGSDHDGLDLVGLDSKEIHSTVNGTVRYAGWENSKNHRQGFGLYVCIKSDADGNFYYFGHMKEDSNRVETGDKVTIGQVIGIEGDTGYSFGSHCHYCVRKKFARGNFLDVCEISGIPNKLGIYDDGATSSTQKKETKPVEKKETEKTTEKKDLKSLDVIANEVIAGNWGNDPERTKKLKEAGYDAKAVQKKVNELLNKNAVAPVTTNGRTITPAQSRNDDLAGTYTVSVDALNMRYIPNKLTNDNIIKVLKRGEKVQNFGFYTSFGNSKWLLIKHGSDTGWISSAFVSK